MPTVLLCECCNRQPMTFDNYCDGCWRDWMIMEGDAQRAEYWQEELIAQGEAWDRFYNGESQVTALSNEELYPELIGFNPDKYYDQEMKKLGP